MAPSMSITPTKLSDVWAFERMRPADAAEVMATGAGSPVEAIIQSWAESKETWTVRFNGEVACMFGIAPHPYNADLTPAAVAWLLTTEAVNRHPKTFYRYSRLIVKDLSKKYGALVNYVDARYGRALEWARRVGFTVHPPIRFGKSGELFHPIVYEV